jgi:hypothetical protein
LPWIDDRYAAEHQFVQDIVLNVLPHFGQLNAIIDANGFLNRQTAAGSHIVTFVHQDPRTVCQVVFGLHVVGLKFSQRAQQPRAVEGIAASVDFCDSPLIFGGILVRNFPKYVAKRSLAKGIPSISLNLKRGANALIDRGDRNQATKAIEEMAANCQRRDVSAVIFPEGTRSRDGTLGEYRLGGLASLIKGAPDLEIIPTVIDGSWKVFAHNMFPVPFGTRVRVAFGSPIPRNADDDPALIVEQCQRWASEVLERWSEDTDPGT